MNFRDKVFQVAAATDYVELNRPTRYPRASAHHRQQERKPCVSPWRSDWLDIIVRSADRALLLSVLQLASASATPLAALAASAPTTTTPTSPPPSLLAVLPPTLQVQLLQQLRADRHSARLSREQHQQQLVEADYLATRRAHRQPSQLEASALALHRLLPHPIPRQTSLEEVPPPEEAVGVSLDSLLRSQQPLRNLPRRVDSHSEPRKRQLRALPRASVSRKQHREPRVVASRLEIMPPLHLPQQQRLLLRSQRPAAASHSETHSPLLLLHRPRALHQISQRQQVLPRAAASPSALLQPTTLRIHPPQLLPPSRLGFPSVHLLPPHQSPPIHPHQQLLHPLRLHHQLQLLRQARCPS